MPVKKIKVSQLKAATTLVGLWTLGVDATNKSVKVSLEFIKKAYDDVVAATKNANDAATEANNAATSANTQADRAKDFADHQPYMGDNGNWWKWNETKKAYEDTGILAKGGVLYPSFEILDDDMCLYMSYQDDIAADQFELDADGCLNFKFK
jgi:hypothetical protein|nr:MAG TPA: hypothetical protein [Caudoviricetes sp.]